MTQSIPGCRPIQGTSICFSAPKGRCIPAQGATLGTSIPIISAPHRGAAYHPGVQPRGKRTPHNDFSAVRLLFVNMRRSFRTPGSGVRSTQGFTLGWYALPLWGNQNNAVTTCISSGERGKLRKMDCFRASSRCRISSRVLTGTKIPIVFAPQRGAAYHPGVLTGIKIPIIFAPQRGDAGQSGVSSDTWNFDLF